MQFQLREATLNDLDTIIRHRHAMFEAMGYVNRAQLDLTDAKFEEWVIPKLRSGEYREWFALDDKGKVVAGAGLWVMEWVPHAIDQSTQRGNILNVYCEPEYRNQGATHLLLIQALDYARDNGIRTLIVNPTEALMPLYQSLGFRQTGEMKIQVSVPN